MAKNSRNLTFTLNNYTEEHVSSLAGLPGSDGVRCVYYGEEVGESGTPHLQGFICFKERKSVRQVVKLVPGAHIELMKGSIEQNIKYCSKEGKVTVHGKLPLTNKEKGKKEIDRWDVARAAAVAGDLEKIASDIYVRHYGTLKRIAADHRPLPVTNPTLENHWYYGPSGTGKSRTAREQNPDAYIKTLNKWWDHYAGEDVVIIEDADPTNSHMGGKLKRWADHYPFRAEFKGGSMMINPKTIIVTSNYTPEEVFTDPSIYNPINRRFTRTHFDEPFKKK